MASGQLVQRQVAAHDELGGLVNASQILAGQLDGMPERGADAQEEGVVLLQQVVHLDISPDAGVEDEFHADEAQVSDLFIHDRLAQFEAGDAVDEQAAGSGPFFVNDDCMPAAGELFGDGDAGRTAADNRDTTTSGGWQGLAWENRRAGAASRCRMLRTCRY